MQSIHLDKYMARTIRGNYVKTDNQDEGIDYLMFRTKTGAKEWIEKHQRDDCFVVKVRTAITPTDSGRIPRMVAAHKARPQVFPQTQQTEFRF